MSLSQKHSPVYDHLLNDEKILWRAMPRSSSMTYTRWTLPEHYGEVLKKLAWQLPLCLTLYLIWMLSLFSPQAINYFVEATSTIEGAKGVWFMAQLFVGLIFLTPLAVSLIRLYLAAIQHDVWYVVSDSRVIWWANKKCEYMFLNNLEQVTLRHDGNHDVLEFHGRVTNEDAGLYGDEVEKIVFVGHKFIDLKDASSIVKLIEKKRDIIIPVEDKRYMAKSKQA